MSDPSLWLSRYRSGERREVWKELVAASVTPNGDGSWNCARDVAMETMSRVRTNVELLLTLLPQAGYRFLNSDLAHNPPASDLLEGIDNLGQRLGPLPLSFECFDTEVGLVDFRQDLSQYVAWQERDAGGQWSEVEILGELDPLVVMAPEPEPWDESLVFFAPDEFHKAGYSGGENYHAQLPCDAPDFKITGMYEINEYFVEYLRETFRFGGFRGRVVFHETAEDQGCWKEAPNLNVLVEIGTQLLEI
jgi:hypothetical protein